MPGPPAPLHSSKHPRSWQPQYRGPILIHSSRSFNHAEQDLCHQAPFNSVLKAHGIEYSNQLPLGKVIAVAMLTNVVIADQIKAELSPQELAFGDFRSGRCVWMFEDMTPLDTPIGYKGRQSIFEIVSAAGIFGAWNSIVFWSLLFGISPAVPARPART